MTTDCVSLGSGPRSLSGACVELSATLRDALLAIDAGGMSAALVQSGDRFVGIVTDGDARRAILGGARLSDPVSPFVNANPVVARVDESRAAVLDLMRARRVAQVPILDSGGQVAGIHTLRGLVGRTVRRNVAVILAGGRGTRLGGAAGGLPKPMVDVAGRPLLERIVHHLVGHGIEQVVISVGYRASIIEEHFGDGSHHGCRILYVRDPDIMLGSAGPLSLVAEALPDIDAPVLVMNGDLVTQFDAGALVDFHTASGSDVTVAITRHSYEVPFGVVSCVGTGRVTEILEKPVRVDQVLAGIYVLEPAVLGLVPPKQPLPMNELLDQCIGSGRTVTAWSTDGQWIDIGRPSDLGRARGQE